MTILAPINYTNPINRTDADDLAAVSDPVSTSKIKTPIAVLTAASDKCLRFSCRTSGEKMIGDMEMRFDEQIKFARNIHDRVAADNCLAIIR